MTRIRAADPDDYRAVMRVVEGALLDVDPGTVRSALRTDGRAFVAVDDERVVGALVLEDARVGDGGHVVAVAVVPGRRGEGVGRELIARADAETAGALTATFDARVGGFYEALGFEIETDDGRLRGVRR